ncbi:MAG TPA: acyloxyacyl hydrolase [Lutibacter sp.]|nr:acyloxyacyl hydrolase [Lutibacter sp.]
MEFYIKIRLILLSFLLFLTTFVSINAQESNTYWQIDYAKGSIIEHSGVVGFLFKENPTLISIGWHKKSEIDSEWKERYNFIDSGFVLNIQNFHNKNLGNTYGLNYTTTHYLRNRNAKNQINIQLGFGVGYNTNPLDFETNLTNIVMSSPILYSQHIKINYTNNRIFKTMGFQSGISFTHYSNGGIIKPNLGLNSVFFNVGLNYHKSEPTIYTKLYESSKLAKQPIRFELGIGGGMHETLPGIGLKPIYYISAKVSKRFNYKNGFQMGFDFFNSESIKDLAVYNAINDVKNLKNTPKDHKQLAFSVGHELYFNKLSFASNIGYYLYRPFKDKTPLYENISFIRYFNNRKSSLRLNLKTHYFEAEHLTLGYHHQLF